MTESIQKLKDQLAKLRQDQLDFKARIDAEVAAAAVRMEASEAAIMAAISAAEGVPESSIGARGRLVRNVRQRIDDLRKARAKRSGVLARADSDVDSEATWSDYGSDDEV
jgi:hypothetical protein